MSEIGQTLWPAGTLLAQLSEPARAQLLRMGAPRVYHPDEVLIAEGERTTYMTLLVAGFVRITKRGLDGRSSLIDVRGAGDTIGELAAKDGLPRSATVTASERVDARHIRRDAYFDLRGSSEFTMALDATDAHRSRYHGRRALDRKEADFTRFVRVLAELAVTYGIHEPDGGRLIPAALTRSDLAELSAITQPRMHDMLRALEDRRLIELGHRRLKIFHVSRLGEIAYPGQEIPVW
jgi:CRP-like cAMP-binding protein